MILIPEQLTSKVTKSAVLEQLAADINAALVQSKDSKKKIRHIADKTGIHQKTLLRLSRSENKPNYMTVFKVYRYLLNLNDDIAVLDQCPEVIKKFLVTNTPATLQKSKHYILSVDLKISQNPIFAEIYVLCSISKVKSKDIHIRFGDYGLELIEQMCNDQVLRHVGENEYILGDNQANLSTESLVTLGKQFVNTYAKPKNSYENGYNYITFMAEGLSNTAYQQLLYIDVEAHKQKTALINDPSNLGKNKFFSFTITDTIEKSEDDL